MFVDEDVDVANGLPLVTTQALPEHLRQPINPLETQLAMYGQLKESMRDAIDPRLLAQNDQAFSMALNNVLTGFGFDRKSAWTHEPEEAPEPEPLAKDAAGVTLTGSPFAAIGRLVRRVFRRR